MFLLSIYVLHLVDQVVLYLLILSKIFDSLDLGLHIVLLGILIDDGAPKLILLLILISTQVAHFVASGHCDIIRAVAER